MTVVRVRGFQIFADRHGRMRCYHRRTKTAVDLRKAPLGSPQFFAECARIAELSKLALPAKPGTLGKLIAEYKAHPAFTDLAEHTRPITPASSSICDRSTAHRSAVSTRPWWSASATRRRQAASAVMATMSDRC